MNYVDIIPYSPLALLVLLPVITGLYQLFFTSLRSPIHFQQGVRDLSSWRSAFTITLIAISPFVCLLPLTPASSLYLYPVGYACAVLFATFCISSVLHYIPSPSICQYIHLRFHLPILRCSVVSVQLVLLTLFATILLIFSASFLSQISTLSPFIVCPLIGYLGTFSIIFGGQTTISAPTFVIPFISVFVGIALVLLNGIEELSDLQKDVELIDDLTSLPTWNAFSLGLINGAHILMSSPLTYQHYFALTTRHRLRTAFLLHLLLFALFSASLLCTSSVYTDFLISLCPLPPTFSSLLQFFRFTIPHSPIFSFFVATSLILVTSVSFSYVLLSLTTLFWEDIVRNYFFRWSQIKQLCTLQVGLFICGTLITLCSTVFANFGEVFLGYCPFLFITLSTLAAPLTAVFLCAYAFPCTNGKGATTGIILSYVAITALSIVHFQSSVLLFPQSPCLNSTSAITVISTIATPPVNNSSLLSNVAPAFQSPDGTQSDIIHFLHTVPFSTFPIIAFMIACIVTMAISLCTGGSDVLALDWNLVVCSSFAHIMVRHGTISSHTRRAFVESESFRYAQQTPYPDTNYNNSKVNLFQNGPKNI